MATALPSSSAPRAGAPSAAGDVPAAPGRLKVVAPSCRCTGVRPLPPPGSRLRAVLHALGPRDVDSARTWAVVVLSATTVVSLLAGLLGSSGIHEPDIVTALVLALLCAALLLLPPVRTAVLSVLTPLAGTAAVVALDLSSSDAGVTGQVFFCLPVLWAATQLRLGGAVLVTACTVVGEAVVVLSLLPTAEALTDLAYMTTLLVLSAAVLARGAEQQDRLVAQLRRQAATDHLTGLVTRRVLDDAAQSALSSAGERGGTALVVVDVDRFKTVNDTHGHLAGDAALEHVAQILAAGCREEDVVARMGGDELAVLMPGCDPEAAARRAEHFVEQVRATPLVLPDGGTLRLSISAGVAHALRDATSQRDLYAAADAALYVAKRGGRDRVGRLPART